MRKYTYNVILGVNQESEPILWNWEQENALAIVGKGGSGKTTAASYYLTQWACQGVKFLIADPHKKNKKDSLRGAIEHIQDALIKPIVSDYADIHTYINYMHELGMARINDEVDTYPLVFVIDEFTNYVLNSPDTKRSALTLLDSVNQFRKADIRLMLIGQSWGQAIKTASQLRDAISSAVVLRASFNDAAKFCSFPSTAKEANLLTPGRGYYLDELLWIPRLTGTGKLIAQKRVAAFNHTSKDTKPLQTLPKLYEREVFLHDLERTNI